MFASRIRLVTARALQASFRAAIIRRGFAVGQNVINPSIKLRTSEGKEVTTKELFEGKKVVLIGVPGAYTPVCHGKHVPAYLVNVHRFQKAGVDTVACVSVNDYFVLKNWAQDLKASNVVFLADSDASFVKSLGLNVDLTAAGLGIRAKRFSMLIDNGKIVVEHVERSPADFEVTHPEAILSYLTPKTDAAKQAQAGDAAKAPAGAPATGAAKSDAGKDKKK